MNPIDIRPYRYALNPSEHDIEITHAAAAEGNPNELSENELRTLVNPQIATFESDLERLRGYMQNQDDFRTHNPHSLEDILRQIQTPQLRDWLVNNWHFSEHYEISIGRFATLMTDLETQRSFLVNQIINAEAESIGNQIQQIQNEQRAGQEYSNYISDNPNQASRAIDLNWLKRESSHSQLLLNPQVQQLLAMAHNGSRTEDWNITLDEYRTYQRITTPNISEENLLRGMQTLRNTNARLRDRINDFASRTSIEGPISMGLYDLLPSFLQAPPLRSFLHYVRHTLKISGNEITFAAVRRGFENNRDNLPYHSAHHVMQDLRRREGTLTDTTFNYVMSLASGAFLAYNVATNLWREFRPTASATTISTVKDIIKNFSSTSSIQQMLTKGLRSTYRTPTAFIFNIIAVSATIVLVGTYYAHVHEYENITRQGRIQ